MKHSMEEIENDIKSIEIKFQTKIYKYNSLEDFLYEEFILDIHKVKLKIKGIYIEYKPRKIDDRTCIKLTGTHHIYGVVLYFRAYINFDKCLNKLTSLRYKINFEQYINCKLKILKRVKFINELLEINV